jgi:hypothetical protein
MQSLQAKVKKALSDRLQKTQEKPEAVINHKFKVIFILF